MELKSVYIDRTGDWVRSSNNTGRFYLKSEVDAAIAELKDAWRSKHKACEALKAKLENVQAGAYADSVDAGMRERRLKRALYKACANWAMSKSLLSYSQAVKFESYLPTKGAKLRRRSSLWHHCYEQCEAMAEEYK